MNLVFGHDESVAAWAAGRYRSFTPCFRALGIVNSEGPLVGAATFHDFNGSNVELCYWGPWSIKIGIARGIARFAFGELKVNRVTACTPRNNRRVKKSLPALGFKFEGVLARYYGPDRKHDAILFGLLRQDATKLLGRSYEP